jgi:hypothetical protein
MAHAPRSAAGLALALAGLLVSAPQAQATRKATTVEALLAYPLFFHNQQIAVRAEPQAAKDGVWLAEGERRVRLVGRSSAVPPGSTGAGAAEVRGTFWDIGRLEPTDPRLAMHDFASFAKATSGRDWPAVGELLAIVADAVDAAQPATAPTIRTIALDPQRYDQQRVTVTGRFRGRNLYGDLPQGPGRSRFDFVLQSADAALWITGIQPKGRDFNFNLDSRLDTGQWLEATGLVRHGSGLVWIEATEVKRAAEPKDAADAAPPLEKPPPPPPPEVVFSTPVEGETEVEPGARIRIQFSRDLDPASLKGKVRVLYLGTVAPGAPDPAAAPADPPPTATPDYDQGNRVLELRFGAPLAPFRTVRIELVEGILSTDGQPLRPWSLTFSTGG